MVQVQVQVLKIMYSSATRVQVRDSSTTSLHYGSPSEASTERRGGGEMLSIGAAPSRIYVGVSRADFSGPGVIACCNVEPALFINLSA
jgi:hypothetical protein